MGIGGVVGNVLREYDIMRYAHVSYSRIIITITLMLSTVAQENTNGCLRREFGAFDGWKKHESATPKSAK